MILLAMERDEGTLVVVSKEFKTTREAIKYLKESGAKLGFEMNKKKVHAIEIKKTVRVKNPLPIKLDLEEINDKKIGPFLNVRKGDYE